MTCNQTEYIIISERRGENSKMFELVNKKRNDLKKNKKGFTLVEVIVVLVILAILAAILIPTMMGWINKANDKTVAAEARAALIAIQTVVTENYDNAGAVGSDNKLSTALLNEAATIGEFEATSIPAGVEVNSTTKQVSFTYNGDGYSITCTNGVLAKKAVKITTP